jgi:hypothetical protein
MQGKCYFIAQQYNTVSHLTMFISLTQLRGFPMMPTRDKPELKIEDCKLTIFGCHFAPSLLKSKEYHKYSIFNRQ